MLYTSDGSTRNFGFWIGSCTYLYDMFHNYIPGWKGVSEISHICSIISAYYLIHFRRYLAQSECDEMNGS